MLRAGEIEVRFNHYDLGHQDRGATVRVTLKGSAANVRLMDDTNLRSFRAGRRHSYHGGFAQRSPVDLPIPRSGRWHLTVDLGGLRGSTRSAVEVLPGALRPIRQELPPLMPVSRAASELGPSTEEGKVRMWDVFVSHAAEDKDGVVRDLVDSLQHEGVTVWYDDSELRIGDSLRRKIDEGLTGSRFGVVVLSPAFFAKNWPQYELDGLVSREMSGQEVILPLWHRVTKAEVLAQSPTLADKLALSTAQMTIEEIAVQIAQVVRERY